MDKNKIIEAFEVIQKRGISKLPDDMWVEGFGKILHKGRPTENFEDFLKSLQSKQKCIK